MSPATPGNCNWGPHRLRARAARWSLRSPPATRPVCSTCSRFTGGPLGPLTTLPWEERAAAGQRGAIGAAREEAALSQGHVMPGPRGGAGGALRASRAAARTRWGRAALPSGRRAPLAAAPRWNTHGARAAAPDRAAPARYQTQRPTPRIQPSALTHLWFPAPPAHSVSTQPSPLFAPRGSRMFPAYRPRARHSPASASRKIPAPIGTRPHFA